MPTGVAFMNRVKICLPVHNGIDYVERCLKSVLDQSYSDFEFVIFENASDDGTRELCEKYAQLDHRVTVVPSQTLLSASENFMRAWKFADANSDYFMLIAHDDYICRDYISVCISALQENPSKMLAAPLVYYLTGDETARARFDQRVLNRDYYTRLFAIKRLTFPASWFYGVYRAGSLGTINSAQLAYPGVWGGDRLIVQFFLLRGQLVYCDSASIFVQMGSDSSDRYREKRMLRRVALRYSYTRALWSQRVFQGNLNFLQYLSFLVLCIKTAAHDTTYTLERILLRK